MWAWGFIALYPIGVPCVTLGLMYKHRKEIRSVMQVAKREQNTLPFESRRAISEIVKEVTQENTRSSVQALRFKFEKLDPDYEWFAMLPMVFRLGQTTLLIFLKRSVMQAMCASWIGLLAIVVQRECAPYLKDSDDAFALRAQWAVFLWISVLLFVHVGITSVVPEWLVGGFLLAVVVGLVGSLVSLAYIDVRAVYTTARHASRTPDPAMSETEMVKSRSSREGLRPPTEERILHRVQSHVLDDGGSFCSSSPSSIDTPDSPTFKKHNPIHRHQEVCMSMTGRPNVVLLAASTDDDTWRLLSLLSANGDVTSPRRQAANLRQAIGDRRRGVGGPQSPQCALRLVANRVMGMRAAAMATAGRRPAARGARCRSE